MESAIDIIGVLPDKDSRSGAVMGPSGCGKSTLLDALAGDSYIPF